MYWGCLAWWDENRFTFLSGVTHLLLPLAFFLTEWNFVRHRLAWPNRVFLVCIYASVYILMNMGWSMALGWDLYFIMPWNSAPWVAVLVFVGILGCALFLYRRFASRYEANERTYYANEGGTIQAGAQPPTISVVGPAQLAGEAADLVLARVGQVSGLEFQRSCTPPWGLVIQLSWSSSRGPSSCPLVSQTVHHVGTTNSY